jgi:DNA-binding protein H-NS
MHHPKKEPDHNYTYFLQEIKMKLSELLQINTSIKNQLNKAEKEIVEKVAALQAAIDKLTQQMSDVELTDEQSQSVLDVQAAGQALDDLNADPEPEV